MSSRAGPAATRRRSGRPTAKALTRETFGPVLKEGPYDGLERRGTLLGLARFKTTASGGGWRSLKDYVGVLRENQTAIYYVTGSDLARLETSPQLEGFRARGVEVLLLPDPVDSTVSGLRRASITRASRSNRARKGPRTSR